MLHESARHLIQTYGYSGIFLLLFIENFGIPVPGQPVFIAAILIAARGELNLIPVVVAAWTGSVAGGIVGFLIGRAGGHKLLEQYGRYIWITPWRLKKAEGFFEKYGGVVILLARFFEGLRQIYAILAGSMNISWRKFIAFNLLGATLWAAVWVGLLLWFGRHMREIWHAFRDNQLTILLLVALFALAAAWIVHVRRVQKAAASPPSELPD